MSADPSVLEGEFDRGYAAEQLRRSRAPLRRLVKAFYLRNMLRELQGPTVDFGCGAGQLLSRLPAGSVGLEVNPHLVAELEAQGLTVIQARGDIADFDLPDLPAGCFKSLVIAHVLEHLPDPSLAFGRLLDACRRLGIDRVLVVVPGARGFSSDGTHKTFVDREYVVDCFDADRHGFRRVVMRYFPIDWAPLGRILVFHEMLVLFESTARVR